MKNYLDFETRHELYNKALCKFGEQNQLRMVQEELAELIVAINKYDRYGGDIELESLIEEMADVEIMLDQLELILIKKEGLISLDMKIKIKNKKLNRLESYLH